MDVIRSQAVIQSEEQTKQALAKPKKKTQSDLVAFRLFSSSFFRCIYYLYCISLASSLFDKILCIHEVILKVRQSSYRPGTLVRV